jgi:hypothetical protein
VVAVVNTLNEQQCCAALVLFVLTLQKDQYGYQFKQLACTHLIVFFTIVPSSFFVPLMFEGLVWFFLPCGLIIVNDIMAYLAGALSRVLLATNLCGTFHGTSLLFVCSHAQNDKLVIVVVTSRMAQQCN